MAKIAQADAGTALVAGREFKTHGNMSGVRGTAYTGILPVEWCEVYRDGREAGAITYTVLSYSTPIAWHDVRFGWIIPDVRYSVTTSKAQGRVRGWLHAEPQAYTLEAAKAGLAR